MFSVDPYVLIIRGVPHELLVSFEPESEPDSRRMAVSSDFFSPISSSINHGIAAMTFCVLIFQALRTGAPSTATWLQLKHFSSSQGLDEVRVFDPPDFRTKSHFEWSALPHFGSTMSKNGYCRSVPEISSNWKTAPQFDMQQVTG